MIELPAAKFVLVSHALCPYVQRVAIALAEKSLSYDRIDIDLANKPDWFRTISPLGKTPVLLVHGRPIFESAVILEYLEETSGHPLHPADALGRAEHRGWIEFGSVILNDIAGLYSAADQAGFVAKRQALANKFAQLESRLKDGPWFDGVRFSLVDAVFGPVFRYLDAFDRIGIAGILDGRQKVEVWRQALCRRKSVVGAVHADYERKLMAFLFNKRTYLSSLMRQDAALEQLGAN